MGATAALQMEKCLLALIKKWRLIRVSRLVCCATTQTHARQTAQGKFCAVKELAQVLKYSPCIPKDTKLFGENMFGVHSIEYDNLCGFFYLFAVQQADGMFLSWLEVEQLWPRRLKPTPPVIFHGKMKIDAELQSHLEGCFALPSGLTSSGPTPEGFVVRVASSFTSAEVFERSVIKYVRANHVQTDSTWHRTWRKASLGGSHV
jgi:hypothetical protein